MDKQIPAQYDPKDIEQKWFERYASTPLFHARADEAGAPYCIVIPPPNVTGILHMGHALNNTIQDVLIRARRMQGRQTLWMPGTDHAGIATQNVVERQLAKEGVKRDDLGREKFLERVWEWKKQYGSTIIHQLKRLGASCDWPRERFTMDAGYSAAVKEVFIRLYEKKLIYRGDYIINWCPRCQTALADEEAPHHDLEGKLYYIKYPLKERPKKKAAAKGGRAKDGRAKGKFFCDDGLVVATTRPETMLGDTAVAVNPKDKRYKHLIGATLILPLLERQIVVIADPLVDKSFGTGAVKVTPAHDPNDYIMGKNHDLEFINIMRPDGVLNTNAGDYAGMDRFEARQAIIEDLRERKLLLKVEDHKHAVGHCYRCHTVIEPYLSKQWFVKMKPLARPAIAAVKKGAIKFTPKRWTKVYLNWMENIRDWCISRQIWWGHRLPVWYCPECTKGSPEAAKNKNRTAGDASRKGVIVARETPRSCPACGCTDLRQDEDVLDTWFSSWLWPFATFGWPFTEGGRSSASAAPAEASATGAGPQAPSKDLEFFYPTSVLVTAPEIIFFWVARMIMAGFEFMGKKPFTDVYIHGTVRDLEGRKMSKSLGNSIDPLEVIDRYGADALRFSLIAIAAGGSDIYLSQDRFEQGRNFANKIWNASRFILMNLKEGVTGDAIDLEGLSLFDRWILHESNETVKKTSRAIDAFRLNEALNIVMNFFWKVFCDWYIEVAKLSLERKKTQETLLYVLKKTLLLLHPFMPFITDEITALLPGEHPGTIGASAWPRPEKRFEDKPCVRRTDGICVCVLGIRQRRHDLNVPPGARVNVVLMCADKDEQRSLEESVPVLQRLAGAGEVTFEAPGKTPPNSVTFLALPRLKGALLLEGLVDIDKEKERLARDIAALRGQVRQKEQLLKRAGFVRRAPQEVVANERARLEELRLKIKNLSEVCDGLG